MINTANSLSPELVLTTGRASDFYFEQHLLTFGIDVLSLEELGHHRGQGGSNHHLSVACDLRNSLTGQSEVYPTHISLFDANVNQVYMLNMDSRRGHHLYGHSRASNRSFFPQINLPPLPPISPTPEVCPAVSILGVSYYFVAVFQ